MFNNKSVYIGVMMFLFLSVVALAVNVDAQLDLYKLTEKEPEPKKQKITKDVYFDYIKQQVYGRYVKLDMPFGEKWISVNRIIPNILKDEYKVTISDECTAEGVPCYEMITTRIRGAMDALWDYYYRKMSRHESGESQQKRVANSLQALKGYIDENKRRWGGVDESPKIMKFIDDYNHLLASTYEKREALRKQELMRKKKAQEEQKAQEAKLQAQRQKEQKALEAQRERERLKAKLAAQREMNRKIDLTVQNAIKNHAKIEKESENFRKDISGVWHHSGTYLIVDLGSKDKKVTIDDLPFFVTVKNFNEEKMSIILHTVRIANEQVETDMDFMLRMIQMGKGFRLGVRWMRSPAHSEEVFGFVNSLPGY